MQNSRRISAFSLIEISIVILIIGVLIAGVTQGSRLLNQAKLSAAKTMTQSSPVASIRNLSLWIESTSDSSFQSSDLDDGTQLTTWNDINPQSVTKADFGTTTTAITTTAPFYKTNVINGLPAVCFNDTTNCGSGTGTTNALVSTNFQNITTASTIFAVVKLPRTSLEAQAILSKRTLTSAYNIANTVNLQLSTNATSTIGWQYCDGTTQTTNSSSCNYKAALTSNSVASNGTYVLSVVYNSNSDDPSAAATNTTSIGITFFQNGVSSGQLATNTSNVAPATSVTSALLLGRASTSNTVGTNYFKGYIGEIIVFDRALKKEERQSIEAYLGKKWGIAMTVAAY